MFARAWLVPLSLLLNAASFQYLVARFYHRRRECRVLLLLAVSLLSVVALVPFATQDETTLSSLNDVSESCLALVLLVQTVLVGSHRRQRHSSSRRGSLQRPEIDVSKLWEPMTLLALAADLLIAYDLAVVALGIASVFRPSISDDFGGADAMNNTAENLTLAFTFLYRFGLRAREHGLRWVLQRDRWELVWHVIFATHEYLFLLVEHTTGTSWERLQALYMRLTLAPCIWLTVGAHAATYTIKPTAGTKASDHQVTAAETKASDVSLAFGSSPGLSKGESSQAADTAAEATAPQRRFADRLQVFSRPSTERERPKEDESTPSE
ncbi:hypothetical protein ATCC90586_008607 [Pythium insidiosum]|nr:hypothetical protein ATCC90586_008607 [Pythium insidiosum]